MVTIKTEKVFISTAGNRFQTLEGVQQDEIECLGFTPDIAKSLVAQSAAVVDILTLTATSKPKARRINGGTKKRKVAAVVAPVTPADGGTVA